MPELPSDDYLWDPKAAPDADVARIEAVLAPLRLRDQPSFPGELPVIRRTHPRRTITTFAALAAGLVLAVVGYELVHTSDEGLPWTVTASAGTPSVRSSDGRATDRLANGGTVETDARSTARLVIGFIGSAVLGHDSRLRLVDAGEGIHRMALDRGSMHATIDAPPRFFLVETPSALVIDLGCEYTLVTDSTGQGRLIVEKGEVEMQTGTNRASVLAGNTATIWAGRGPGLPYPSRASEALVKAVANFDRSPTSQSVGRLLGVADGSSTITLWHLLQRAPEPDRGAVFDRLAAISPPPASVTRDRVIRGESYALQRWRTELQRTWVRETLWARLARELQAD